MKHKMILLCGIPSEGPIARVKEALMERGEQVVIFNQRQYAEMDMDWSFVNRKPLGKLCIYNCSYELSDFKSAYIRFMAESELPEMKDEDDNGKVHCSSVHEAMYQWLEVTDSKVVNKHSSMFSNSSKPYQGLIIRKYGLQIPPTIITNKPENVLEFQKKFGSIIYKSISGVRSIVREFDKKDLDRLEKIKFCPVQFQARLSGFDVRVHVIGEKTIATKIRSTGVDYRYATRDGGETDLEPFKIPRQIENACIKVTKALGLHFSGIDLRFTENGVYCFEVNPMPGYSYYESNTGQDISGVLADYLIEG